MKKFGYFIKFTTLDIIISGVCGYITYTKIFSGSLWWFLGGAACGYLALIFAIDILVEINLFICGEIDNEWLVVKEAIPGVGEIFAAMFEGFGTSTRLSANEKLKVKDFMQTIDEYHNGSHNRIDRK